MFDHVDSKKGETLENFPSDMDTSDLAAPKATLNDFHESHTRLLTRGSFT